MIRCPKCGEEFEPSEAYKHELEEKLKKEQAIVHAKDLERIKKAAEEEAKKELLLTQEELVAMKKRASEAEEEEIKMRRQMRELEEEKRKFELDKQRQLDQERDKIRQEAMKLAEEGMSLHLAQERKKNEDAQKQIVELQRKLQQGSQQAQGEVLELELESLLKRDFPLDIIEEVKKGQRGADVVQGVVDKHGKKCGVILWESKNAQWSGGWIPKLKENVRTAKAVVGVLVATNVPESIDGFGYVEGVWVVKRHLVVGLATALRQGLIRAAYEKSMQVNRTEKSEVLYAYMASGEFKHRVEAIVEAFGEMQNTLEQERRWFTTKWAKQEKQIRRVIDNTQGMYGDLQAVMGLALPRVEQLELGEGE